MNPCQASWIWRELNNLKAKFIARIKYKVRWEDKKNSGNTNSAKKIQLYQIQEDILSPRLSRKAKSDADSETKIQKGTK